MSGYKLYIIWAVLLIQGSSLTAGQTATHASETSLRANLSSGYDQATRPYTPTYIDVTYYLRSVQALNIASQQFTHTAFLTITWHDPRLTWTAADYSNITELDINWTWRPKFMIGNSVDSVEMYGTDNDVARVIVYNNGSVTWMMTMVPNTACEVDILNFPYDQQECNNFMVFLGSNYGGNLMLNQSTTEVETWMYLEHAEWERQSSSMMAGAMVTCCPTTSIGYLNINMKFQRMHSFYMNTFLIPTILMSICLVWPFYLPTDCGERLGFSLTILLAYTVVLSMTSVFLPTTSKQVPHLAAYLLAVLFMCTISVCNVALHVKLYYITAAPPAFAKAFYRKMKPIVFLECCKKKPVKVEDRVLTVSNIETEKPRFINDKDREEPSESPEVDEEITWPMVSQVMDRVCFLLYSVAVLIMNVVLMAYLSG